MKFLKSNQLVDHIDIMSMVDHASGSWHWNGMKMHLVT
jgi:hypothetical protein